MRGDLPAGGWGARGQAAWQRWPCCAGFSGMLPAEVRAQSQLPVGTPGPMGVRGPQAGEGCSRVLQRLWGASGSQLSAHARRAARSGRETPGLARERSRDLQSPCAAASAGHRSLCLIFCFTLILLKIAGRGCPVVVYRCFAEGFVNFWSCTCLYKYIYIYIYIHAHTYTFICECMYVAVHVINPSPYLHKTPPGTQGRADNTVIGGQGGPGQPSNPANELYLSPKPAGPFSQKGCVRNQTPSLASVWVLLTPLPGAACTHLPFLEHPKAPSPSSIKLPAP